MRRTISTIQEGTNVTNKQVHVSSGGVSRGEGRTAPGDTIQGVTPD